MNLVTAGAQLFLDVRSYVFLYQTLVKQEGLWAFLGLILGVAKISVIQLD